MSIATQTRFSCWPIRSVLPATPVSRAAFSATSAGRSLATRAFPRPALSWSVWKLKSRPAGRAPQQKSYTKSLLDAGVGKIGDKMREEADEFARALQDESDERVASEAADVVYHLLVGLASRGTPWRAVLDVLAQRSGTSGHEEKASLERLPVVLDTSPYGNTRSLRAICIKSLPHQAPEPPPPHAHQSSRFRERSLLRRRASHRARTPGARRAGRRRRQRRAPGGRLRSSRSHPALHRAAADERLLGLQQAQEGSAAQRRAAHHHVERVERRDLRAAPQAAHARRGLRPQADRLRRAARAHPHLRPARGAPRVGADRHRGRRARARLRRRPRGHRQSERRPHADRRP